jgi:hypothetical protein
MTLWDAARAANRRPLRKPIKFHEPVGDHEFNARSDGDQSCRDCGYSVCNCPYAMPPYGLTNLGSNIQFNAFIERGKAFWMPHFGIQAGLLKLKELEIVKEFAVPLDSTAVITVL